MGNVNDAMNKYLREQEEENRKSAKPEPPQSNNDTANANSADGSNGSNGNTNVKHKENPAVSANTATVNQAIAKTIATEIPVFEPQTRKISYDSALVSYHDRGGQITEQYRSLRTNLQAHYRGRPVCTTVVSAEPGEGKTITCLNLAITFTESPDYRIIVIDGDLRKSRVASSLGLKNTPGFVDVLQGKMQLEEVIQPTSYPNLQIVPAGKVKHDQIGELLSKPECSQSIAQLRKKYDCVLIDTPPVTLVSDASVLSRAAGEALLVYRMGKTSRESADRAIRLMHAASVEMAGVVLTHNKHHIPHYRYSYS